MKFMSGGVSLVSIFHRRKNLKGPGSNLFWKLVEIIRIVQEIFAPVASVKWVVENVASMDPDARDEISSVLEVLPLRLDPADVLPYSRPRFAWISEEPSRTEGCELVQREGFVEVTMTATGVAEAQWIQPGWNRVDPSCPLPTFMKSIKREQPPPVPAGLRRTPWDAQGRWADDEFRFPPYQYKEQFMLTDDTVLRYVSSGEREILMGFGAQHTRFCFPASETKKNPVRYEDERLSLIGDSFCMLSFGWVAGLLCRAARTLAGAQEIVDLMGLAPGACSRAGASAPMERWKHYGFEGKDDSPQDAEFLVNKLALGANHTGSDVRITTGELMTPSKSVRQSTEAIWWSWKQVFSKKWQFQHHINALEMRALLLGLQWRAQRPGHLGKKVVHLVDGFVTLGIVCKGRTSSLMLRSLSRQIAAHVLAMGITLILAHVDSTENPADEGSRE